MTRYLVLSTLAALTAMASADPKDAKNAPAGMSGKKPPAELTEVGHLMTGTWKCEGTVQLPDRSTAKLKATVTAALELGGFWIHETLDIDIAPAFKVEAYMTFDGAKWHRDAFDTLGGHATGTADPMKDHKLDWAIDNAGVLEKVHLDLSDPKKGTHLVAERSMDKGKTWGKGPDLVCKK